MLAMRTDAYRQAAAYRWMPYLARRRPSGPARRASTSTPWQRSAERELLITVAAVYDRRYSSVSAPGTFFRDLLKSQPHLNLNHTGTVRRGELPKLHRA